MANTSERVQQLKKNFMKHHNEGKTIKEISEHYNVSTRHIYFILQEIADENNVSRESLLTTPHREHPRNGSAKTSKQVKPQEIREKFDTMISNAKTLIKKIDYILQEEK
ncbi:MAG: hypothetical protein ACI4VH_07040 [Clostridia bacterium]